MADEKLDVAFAEFRGEMRQQMKDLSQDVKTINAVLAAQNDVFVPRREIEEKFTHHHGRIAKLESHQIWTVRAVVGAWLSGIAVVWGKVAGKL